ncbi:MAG TPA: tetratricopeptide repeat protein [Pyrinomonadaceae bacterium]|nr:tetratricopeptide repeat protein [Pyrinomonadaceae bacterium]
MKAAGLCATILAACGAATTVICQSIATPTKYRLSVPEKNWALELVLPTIDVSYKSPPNLPTPSFVRPVESLTRNRIALLFAVQVRKDRANPGHLFVRVMPGVEGMSADDLRSFTLKKLTHQPRDLKTSQHDQFLVASYKTQNQPLKTVIGTTVTENYLGPRFTRHLEAYFVRGDVSATVTLTATAFEREDEEQFYSLLHSVQFVDVATPNNSFDYYHVGRSWHFQQEHARALEALETVVRLELAARTLDATLWRNLVTMGAESATALGRLNKAVEFLQLGVHAEPTNTELLMDLARTYARLGDTGKTLATLRTLFPLMKQEKEVFENTKFPGVASSSMSLPDISRDPAFKELMKDKSFREAVKDLKK